MANKVLCALSDRYDRILQKTICKYVLYLQRVIVYINCVTEYIKMHLTDYKITPPHIAFEADCDAAKKREVNVTGSEIIGLVPLEAMLMAGRYYINSKKNKNEVKEYDLLCKAIEYLGLNDINSFIPEEMIIEYKLKRKFE